MSAQTNRPLRQYLYILAAVVALSLLGVLGFTIYVNTQHAVTEEQSRLRTLSIIIASNTTNVLEQNKEALELIAKRPAIQAMNPAKCDPILKEFHSMFPHFANLATVDLHGTAPCSGVPQPGGKPVSVANTEWFKRGMAEQRFLAGNPFYGPITHRWVSVLVQPVRDARDELQGFIGLPLDLANFDPHISDAPLPEGTRFGIIGGDGTLIWRNVDPEQLVGKYIGDQPGPRDTLLVKNGEFKSTGTDGLERYYSVVPIPMVNWYAYVGVESRHVFASTMKSALDNSLLALVNLVVIGILLVFLVRRIAQADAELEQARLAAVTANRAKSIFLANMSHELRTPLNAILGFSSMMRKDPALAKPQHDNLDIINRSGEHLLSLINDVLEMAKIEAGRIELLNEPFDLGLVVRDVTDMMQARAREKGLQLHHRPFVRLSALHQRRRGQAAPGADQPGGQRGEVHRAGRHHGAAGRQARWRAAPPADRSRGLGDGHPAGRPANRVRAVRADRRIRHAKRHRPGVDHHAPVCRVDGRDAHPAKRAGHGFHLQGGAAVAAGGGSRHQREQAVEEAGEVLALAPGQPECRVLVAEDQVENRLLLAKLLHSVGFKVMLAENGEQAVRLFQSWHPHFIWMDRRMPRIDGVEATKRIRALPDGSDVKIVAVTASVFQEQRDELTRAGMDDFVRKPYRSNEIYQCMAKHLGVRYLYGGELAAEKETVAELTPAMLQALAAPLRTELAEALSSLDSERIDAVITEISQQNGQLAKTLARLAAGFDYPAILRALEAVEPGAGHDA